MLSNLKNVLVDEDGATLVEYALIVSLIAIACIGATKVLSTQIQTSFKSISTQLGSA